MPVFKDADVDDSCLDPGVLKDADLRELGLPLGPRVRILRAIQDRNAGARPAAPAAAPRPPPPPPLRAATTPPPYTAAVAAAAAAPEADDDDTLCELCADREVDCKIAGCGHTFCRVCVELWRRESVRKAQQKTMCPSCRQPFTEVVDLETGRVASKAPRSAWGAAAPPPPVPFLAAAAEEEARRSSRPAAAAPRAVWSAAAPPPPVPFLAAAEEEETRRRREAEAEAARERAATEARARAEEATASENAAAVATFYATNDAPQWAQRAGSNGLCGRVPGNNASEVRAEATEHARAAVSAHAESPAGRAYVAAYAAAAMGAFVDAKRRASAKAPDEATVAVVAAFIGETVAACRRDAAGAALAEVAAEGPRTTPGASHRQGGTRQHPTENRKERRARMLLEEARALEAQAGPKQDAAPAAPVAAPLTGAAAKAAYAASRQKVAAARAPAPKEPKVVRILQRPTAAAPSLAAGAEAFRPILPMPAHVSHRQPVFMVPVFVPNGAPPPPGAVPINAPFYPPPPPLPASDPLFSRDGGPQGTTFSPPPPPPQQGSG